MELLSAELHLFKILLIQYSFSGNSTAAFNDPRLAEASNLRHRAVLPACMFLLGELEESVAKATENHTTLARAGLVIYAVGIGMLVLAIWLPFCRCKRNTVCLFRTKAVDSSGRSGTCCRWSRSGPSPRPRLFTSTSPGCCSDRTHKD